MPQPYNWNIAPIEQRRRILDMSDLWDGNTYAMLRWDEFPKHIQGDIEKTLNFAGLVIDNEEPEMLHSLEWNRKYNPEHPGYYRNPDSGLALHNYQVKP